MIELGILNIQDIVSVQKKETLKIWNNLIHGYTERKIRQGSSLIKEYKQIVH